MPPVSFSFSLLTSTLAALLRRSGTAHHLQDARKACGDSTLTQVRCLQSYPGTRKDGGVGWPSGAWVSEYHHLPLSVVLDHSWAGPSGANSDENTEDPPWTPGQNLCHALGDRLKVRGWPHL